MLSHAQLLDRGFDLPGTLNLGAIVGAEVDGGNGRDDEAAQNRVEGAVSFMLVACLDNVLLLDEPDSMTSGAGNDNYRVDDAGDVLVEAEDAGYNGVKANWSQSKLKLTGI